MSTILNTGLEYENMVSKVISNSALLLFGCCNFSPLPMLYTRGTVKENSFQITTVKETAHCICENNIPCTVFTFNLLNFKLMCTPLHKMFLK